MKRDKFHEACGPGLSGERKIRGVKRREGYDGGHRDCDRPVSRFAQDRRPTPTRGAYRRVDVDRPKHYAYELPIPREYPGHELLSNLLKKGSDKDLSNFIKDRQDYIRTILNESVRFGGTERAISACQRIGYTRDELFYDVLGHENNELILFYFLDKNDTRGIVTDSVVMNNNICMYHGVRKAYPPPRLERRGPFPTTAMWNACYGRGIFDILYYIIGKRDKAKTFDLIVDMTKDEYYDYSDYYVAYYVYSYSNPEELLHALDRLLINLIEYNTYVPGERNEEREWHFVYEMAKLVYNEELDVRVRLEIMEKVIDHFIDSPEGTEFPFNPQTVEENVIAMELTRMFNEDMKYFRSMERILLESHIEKYNKKVLNAHFQRERDANAVYDRLMQYASLKRDKTISDEALDETYIAFVKKVKEIRSYIKSFVSNNVDVAM